MYAKRSARALSGEGEIAASTIFHIFHIQIYYQSDFHAEPESSRFCRIEIKPDKRFLHRIEQPKRDEYYR